MTNLPSSIAHYRVTAKLGEGGMGEVYRATDTKLGRDVAIKVIPDAFAQDASRMARFAREAQVLAALNHPNIAAIYGVEETALVLELVEGPTLAERTAQGPILVEEALPIARQIAEAVEYAHERGIVHRDLKPANIKLTPEGRVKVLDFGLAKLTEQGEGSVTALTQTMAIAGTPGYLAPEQLQGKPADARSDIFAFGCVLYELLSGRRAFPGNTLAASLASTAMAEPKAIEGAPEELEKLVRRCLRKDPARRAQHMGDVRIALEEIQDESRTGYSMAPGGAKGRATWFPWAVAGVLAVAAVAGWMRPGSAVSEPQSMTLTIVPPSGVALPEAGSWVSAPEISPDGSAVMYYANSRLYVRRLAAPEPQAVPGFEALGGAPFWSADSTAVVFPAALRLMKTRLPDGPPEPITPLSAPSRGGSCSDTGKILIAANPGAGLRLLTGPISGGALSVVEMPSDLKDGEIFNPEFLPGGDDFLFLFVPSRNPDDAAVYRATLRGDKAADPALLLKNQTAAHYTPAGGGRILFVRNDNLYWQRLNRSSRKPEGQAELVAQGVASQPSMRIYRGDFSVARNGTIAWRPGKAALSQITVFDRQGNPVGSVGPPGPYANVTLSPDGKQVLSALVGGWLMDVGQTGRLALPNGVRWFGWMADRSKLVGMDGSEFVEMSASGSGEVRRLRQAGANGLAVPTDLSSDGKQVLGIGDRGIFSQQIEGTPEETAARLLVENSSDTTASLPRFSPDGTWFLYQTRGSDRSRGGLYVSPFRGPGLRRQIAPVAAAAVWRGDGKEIVYYSQGSMMSVTVEAAGSDLRFGAPRTLFSGLRLAEGARTFAVSRDGSRIFLLQGTQQPESNMIYIKTGWAK